MDSGNQAMPMLAIRDVARLLNVHENTVRRWSDRGLLKSYRLNHRGDRRFRKDHIALFMSQLKAHNGNVEEIRINWEQNPSGGTHREPPV